MFYQKIFALNKQDRKFSDNYIDKFHLVSIYFSWKTSTFLSKSYFYPLRNFKSNYFSEYSVDRTNGIRAINSKKEQHLSPMESINCIRVTLLGLRFIHLTVIIWQVRLGNWREINFNKLQRYFSFDNHSRNSFIWDYAFNLNVRHRDG